MNYLVWKRQEAIVKGESKICSHDRQAWKNEGMMVFVIIMVINESLIAADINMNEYRYKQIIDFW